MYRQMIENVGGGSHTRDEPVAFSQSQVMVQSMEIFT